MTHRNARLTPVTRAELVEQVLAGWPQAEVARLFRVSRATVAKWMRRFREGGSDALHDRSSRPLRSPRQTDQLQEAAICAARRMLAWGPHRIGWRLGIARSTVYAVLRRAGLHRLAWLHRTTREIVRYEHARPGALVHLDIKKLGRIPQGGGKRILPGFAGTRSGPQRGPRLGFDFVHVAVDDHSRYAYVEALPDERGPTAAAFLVRALAHFERQGIAVERILTDNGSCYVSRIFTDTAAARNVRLKAHAAFPASDQRQGGGVQQDHAGRVGLPATVLLQPRAAQRAAWVPRVLQSPASTRRHRRGYSRLPPVNNVPGNYS